jgi:hypothetical protein
MKTLIIVNAVTILCKLIQPNSYWIKELRINHALICLGACVQVYSIHQLKAGLSSSLDLTPTKKLLPVSKALSEAAFVLDVLSLCAMLVFALCKP